MKNILAVLVLMNAMSVLAQAPSWSINSNAYQYNMTVTAVVDVNCIELANTSNKLAAFKGDTIRGLANTTSILNGKYIATMSVYSNNTNGEDIHFQFYDSVGDSVYVSVDSIAFKDNAVHGSPSAPLVIRTNNAPTAFQLDMDTLIENAPTGQLVGLLSSTDANTAQSHSYTVVNGTGSTDNDLFSINGNQLIADTVANFEIKDSYTIRLRTTDSEGCYFEDSIQVNVKNANDSPAALSIDTNKINENLAVNTIVGSLNAIDEDANESFTYALVSGIGDTDNADFTISGNDLKSSTVFNYELQSKYKIRLRVTDVAGAFYEDTLNILINDQNDIPSDISITIDSVLENTAKNTLIGSLSTIDEDVAQTYSYSFDTIAGNENDSFLIVGNELRTNGQFDFEGKASYTVYIKTEDLNGGDYTKQITIRILDANDTPEDIILGSQSVNENNPSGTFIGTIRTIDQDVNNNFIYSFSNGAGSSNNTNFSIRNDSLFTAKVFDLNTQAAHQIRIQTDDGEGGVYSKAFVIHVKDINNVPTAMVLSNNTISEKLGIGSEVGELSTTDSDRGDIHTYSLVSGNGDTDNSSFIINDDKLQTNISFNVNIQNLYSIRIQTDDGFGGTYEDVFTINILSFNDVPTDILLSAKKVPENSATNAIVGTLSSVDSDSTDVHTYSFIGGANDNSSFIIVDKELRTKESFNFEIKTFYFVHLQSDDGNGGTISKQFTIEITDAADAPTAIQIDNNTIFENQAAPTYIGRLTSVDEDSNDSFSYSLIGGSNTTDNAAFQISNDSLFSVDVFDYELQEQYQIRLRSTDTGNLFIEKAFVINVLNRNEAPTIEKQSFVINENTSAGTVVGKILVSDVDQNETFIYRLLESNNHFNIDPFSGELHSARMLDYEGQVSYDLVTEVTDAGGLKDTAKLTVEVLDQIEGSLPAAGYFSPNGDGMNDLWSIQNVELYSNYELSIFSVNGQMVYEKSSNYANDWDGTINGSQLPEGVYYFYLKNKLTSNNNFKGTITLKR